MANVNILNLFDQRHKWVLKDEYTAICKVCGKSKEIYTLIRCANRIKEDAGRHDLVW